MDLFKISLFVLFSVFISLVDGRISNVQDILRGIFKQRSSSDSVRLRFLSLSNNLNGDFLNGDRFLNGDCFFGEILRGDANRARFRVIFLELVSITDVFDVPK